MPIARPQNPAPIVKSKMARSPFLPLAAAALLLAGCSPQPAILHVPRQVRAPERPPTSLEPKRLVVFMDGTANEEGSHTNVAKLHNLVTLQADTTISTVYIEGVGNGLRVDGMIAGAGIAIDVRQAYRYLGENYRRDRGDRIYIFGFSRGAYAARILAAMIHVAGVPDLLRVPKRHRARYVRNIYSAYKVSGDSIAERRRNVRTIIGKDSTAAAEAEIEFLGLWDTVEVLALPDLSENVDLVNPRHADQLCNVKRAAHAVSLDDDRAEVFTPVLLTRPHLVEQCEKPVDIDAIVEEVWFSGAHSDVGGGYADTDIDGVSLNWMLEQIEPYGLVPPGTRVYEDPYGITHNPDSGFVGLFYPRKNRDVGRYARTSTYNGRRLKIHASVLDRLARVPVQPFESRWFDSTTYAPCFQHRDTVVVHVEGEACARVIQIVHPRAKPPARRAEATSPRATPRRPRPMPSQRPA